MIESLSILSVTVLVTAVTAKVVSLAKHNFALTALRNFPN
jgi:hypothetical protein